MTFAPADQATVQQLFDLTGKTALLTGASGYLGSAMASALAEAGASVVVSSRDRSRAQAAADRLPCQASAKAHAVVIDQMNPDSIHEGFQQAIESANQIDILVNNGLAATGADLSDCTFDQFAQHQANNAGYFELARLVHDHAVERKSSASVIMVGSMYGMVGSYPDAYAGICKASPVAYHALKGGTLQLTRHLAVYWAADSVRVNSLSPGPFPAPTVPDGLADRLQTHCPMGRMGRPCELKGAIVFLASNASSYMTGQNLVVDGGWTAW